MAIDWERESNLRPSSEEVYAWVNPAAWDNLNAAQECINEIMERGAVDGSDWAEIAERY